MIRSPCRGRSPLLTRWSLLLRTRSLPEVLELAIRASSVPPWNYSVTLCVCAFAARVQKAFRPQAEGFRPKQTAGLERTAQEISGPSDAIGHQAYPPHRAGSSPSAGTARHSSPVAARLLLAGRPLLRCRQ